MEHNHTNGSAPGLHSAHNHGLPVGNEGLFLSHSYLGTFVFGIGLWWWVHTVRHRPLASQRSNSKCTPRTSRKSRCCRSHMVEGLIKLCICFIGIWIEAATERMGRHQAYTHYPFYTAYLVAALVNVLQSTLISLPDGVEYVCELLPFVFQAYCLRSQAYDQPHVTASCRFLSSYLGALAALSIACEIGYSNQFLFNWLKCFMVMVSGAWTCQMGLILNPPIGDPWNEDNHDNVMYVAIVCAWQMFGVVVLQLITLLFVARCQGIPPDWANYAGSLQMDQQHIANKHEDIVYSKLLEDDPLNE